MFHFYGSCTPPQSLAISLPGWKDTACRKSKSPRVWRAACKTCQTHHPLPEGVEVREATEDQDLGELSEFAAWRWGVPEEYRPQLRDILKKFEIGKPDSNTRMWLAWKDGIAISKIGLYKGSGSAGIYGVATKPEARGLGIASVLMVTAMRAARVMGYDLIVLDSSPLAEKLYQRLGFVTLTPIRLFSQEPAYL